MQRLWHSHIFCSNACIFIDFGYDWHFMLILFKFLQKWNNLLSPLKTFTNFKYIFLYLCSDSKLSIKCRIQSQQNSKYSNKKYRDAQIVSVSVCIDHFSGYRYRHLEIFTNICRYQYFYFFNREIQIKSI